MSSKTYENDLNKKKKHKHKNRDNDKEEVSTLKNNKYKQIIKDETPTRISKTNKHVIHLDTDDEFITKNVQNQKKDKKHKHKNDANIEQIKPKNQLTSIPKQMPISSTEDDSDSVEYVKNNVNIGNKVEKLNQKNTKVKLKIYSSSEDEAAEDVPVTKTTTTTETKRVDSDDYFDGWLKEDVVQLISKMTAALPKNDTLKYVSRVEKLNWQQVAFGNHTSAECKEKWKVIEKKIRKYRILQEVLADAKIWLEHPWTDFYRGGKKKNRHPDMPKKPLSSYMIFYMKKKEKLTKERPGIGMTTLSKIIADKFNKLSIKKKAKYNKLANEMKEKYQEAMQKFYLDHPSEGEKIINASKNKKSTITGMPGPAKPIPPLKLFLEDKIKQHKDDKDFNQAKLMQQCKEKWKSMSSKKKMPWIRWAHEAEVKYLEELKSYKAENPSFEMPKIKSVLSKEEKKVLQRMEGKPEKPPGSAYGLFSKLMLKDPDLRAKYSTPKERMQEIAKMWKEASKLEKDSYGERVKHLLENYKLEYASYLESLPEDKREEELASNLPKRKAKTEDAGKMNQKKLKVQNESTKKKEKVKVEDLLMKEPKPPSGSSFDLYQEDMKNKGYNSKKIKKSWDEASEGTKQKYENKLESLRQKYIIDYKHFLTTLKPEELRTYSEWKVKNKTSATELDSPVLEINTEESDVEEDPKEEVNKKGNNTTSSGSSDSSSSSSSGSSSSESSSSSSGEGVSEDDDDDVSDAF